jgi:predicted transcriptional regulator
MATILVVDDQPDTVEPLKLQAGADDFLIRYCHDVTTDDLEAADLVLVDYRLDEWPERDNLDAIAMKPLNGLALASILRGHALARRSRPTAFALHAADLTELSTGVPTDAREQIIARLHNLEWAFRKDATAAGVNRIRSLARAVAALPEDWPFDNPESRRHVVQQLLALDGDVAWFSAAEEDIEGCLPPVRDLATATHGRSFLRWIAQRILPYPTFVFGDLYLAARLGVSLDSLREELSKNASGLAASLEPVAYKGLLHDFVDRRWWRAGINVWLWELSDGNPFDRERILARLREIAPQLAAVSAKDSVVALDEKYRPAHLIDASAAVEIQLDDWPLFADKPWIEASRATKDPIAADFVVTADRTRIRPNE